MDNSNYSSAIERLKGIETGDCREYTDKDESRDVLFENRINSLLTAKQAARILGVSSKSLYKWAAIHRIPRVKMGRSVRFKPETIAEIIDGVRSL